MNLLTMSFIHFMNNNDLIGISLVDFHLIIFLLY